MKIYETEYYNPKECVDLGTSIGMWLGPNSMILTGRDGKSVSRLVRRAISVGITSTGVSILDMRVAPKRIVSFQTWKHSMGGGLYVCCEGGRIQVHLLSSEGQSIRVRDAQKILTMLEKKEFRYAGFDELGTILFYPNGLEDFVQMVTRKIMFQAPTLQILVDCRNSPYAILAPMLFERYAIKIKLINENSQCYEPPDTEERFLKTLVKEEFDCGVVLFDDRIDIYSKNGELEKSVEYFEELMVYLKDCFLSGTVSGEINPKNKSPEKNGNTHLSTSRYPGGSEL